MTTKTTHSSKTSTPEVTYYGKMLNSKGRRVAAVYRRGQWFVPKVHGKLDTGARFQKADHCAQHIADELGIELTWMEPLH